MYHTTGFDRDDITELCLLIHAEAGEQPQEWPPILGLYKSTVVTLTYLRRNRVQAEIGEAFGVSQSTISRAIAAITPLLERALRAFVPTAEELDVNTQYLIDGSLLPCWSWADHRELYSGKHKTTGMNVQIVCTLDGALAWISDPIDGCHHDVYCLDESEALVTMKPSNWTGDKGYVGRDMVTPIRKPADRDLLDWETQWNKQINSERAAVERVISHFKSWRIMHTDFRRPLQTFRQTISAVVGLHFYRTA